MQSAGNPAFPLSAKDQWLGLPAVGQNGNLVPLQSFEEALNGVGSDGSRAHHLEEPCGIERLTATGFAVANAASFAGGAVAQDSIVTAKGVGFAGSTEVALTNPAPKTLAGRSVSVTDSEGVTRDAPLLYVSTPQINFVVPEGTAIGASTISVTGGAGKFEEPVWISASAPGLFAADGLAAANVLTVVNGEQAISNTIVAGEGGGLALNPIDLGSEGQQTYLVLYGTGIQHHQEAVKAMLGDLVVEAAYAGTQGYYAGEDQINILLPRSLAGAGEIAVTLDVDGKITNPVHILIQ